MSEEDNVRFSFHELNLRARLNQSQAVAKITLRNSTEEKLLIEHYLKGAPHPHDFNLPINLWEFED